MSDVRKVCIFDSADGENANLIACYLVGDVQAWCDIVRHVSLLSKFVIRAIVTTLKRSSRLDFRAGKRSN